MCTMTSTATRSLAPPLAADGHGNPLHIPDEAVAWRVRRHTGGRPRMVLAADRRPLLLPLDTTEEDLNDILGPGSYRLDAVDEEGEVLDCVVCTAVGDVEPERPVMGTSSQPVAPPRASDLRVVLEANVQMARSLSDAVRVLSEAQADWTKGLASAKAIPRNAAQAAPMVVAGRPPEPRQEDEVDEDYEPTWYERLATSIPAQYLPGVLTAVGDLVERFNPRPASTQPLRNAAPDDEQEEQESAEEFRLTPELLRKMEEVKARLSPSELRVVTNVLSTAGPQMLAELGRELAPLTVEAAVERVKTMLAGRAKRAETQEGDE